MQPPHDDTFDAAWRAFASQDARVEAPPALEQRVWECVRASQAVGSRPERRLRALVGAAALIGLTIAAASWPDRRATTIDPAIDRLGVVSLTGLAPYKDGIEATPAVVKRQPPRPRLPAVDRGLLAELPPAILNFGSAPIGNTEILQLVRLRLPRERLQTLGVVLMEPDADGLVDIDVLVGEDGLARDIRQVRTGQE